MTLALGILYITEGNKLRTITEGKRRREGEREGGREREGGGRGGRGEGIKGYAQSHLRSV